MSTFYEAEPTNLTPFELKVEDYIHIGQIIRAAAEIEDLLTIYIRVLANISESQSALLIGRSQISQKQELAVYLAKAQGENELANYNKYFGTDLKEFIKCRNAVAHGILLGQSEEGRICFLLNKTNTPQDGSVIQEVTSFKSEDLKHSAEWGLEMVDIIEEHLGFSELRKKRAHAPLRGHRKGQKQKPRKKTS